MVDVQYINLNHNHLLSLPESVSNLVALQRLYLCDNKLTSLPNSIKKIKKYLVINESSYDINNLNLENEILLFFKVDIPLLILPIKTKEIWIKKETKQFIKLLFGYTLNYY